MEFQEERFNKIRSENKELKKIVKKKENEIEEYFLEVDELEGKIDTLKEKETQTSLQSSNLSTGRKRDNEMKQELETTNNEIEGIDEEIKKKNKEIKTIEEIVDQLLEKKFKKDIEENFAKIIKENGIIIDNELYEENMKAMKKIRSIY